MYLYISSREAAVLAQARAYIEGKFTAGVCQKQDTAYSSSSTYEIDISDEEGKALLDALLAAYPTLRISGSFISDLEDRDRSFWQTTTYESAVDKDGKPYFEVSSSTDWA